MIIEYRQTFIVPLGFFSERMDARHAIAGVE